MSPRSAINLIALLLALSAPASWAGTYAVLSGASHHESPPDATHPRHEEGWNEENWGLGIERRTDLGGFATVFAAGFFRDSNENWAQYAGAGFELEIGSVVDVALTAALMRRRFYHDEIVRTAEGAHVEWRDHTKLVFVPTPRITFSWPGRKAGVSILYLPDPRTFSRGTWFLQTRVALF